MNYLLYQVDAFTDRMFGGNPAAVIPLADFPSDDFMQNVARENNLSETTFVVPTGPGKFKIRWFTPTQEVRLCGHATLAAAHILFLSLEKEVDELRFTTRKAGTLKVKRKGKKAYAMNFPADPPQKTKAPSYLAHALGVEPKAVLTGKDDMMVVLDKESQVRKLKPNLELLSKIRKRGVIVTAPGKKCDFVSRCFYPRFGIQEDPVTGSAHTVMAPYWSKKLKKKRLSARQLSDRLGEIGCEVKNKRVILSGSAVTYLTGEIRMENLG